MSDFDVFKKMVEENTSDGIALFPDIVSVDIQGGNGFVKFGMPAIGAKWQMDGTHIFLCYAIKKEDYDRIKSSISSD
jgi:hypothetical protein